MTSSTSMHASTIVAKKSPAAKKTAAAPKVSQVTLRRLARDFGSAKKGQIVLIIDPAKFGSLGDNWLGGRSYTDRDAAVAAARKAGAKVVNA